MTPAAPSYHSGPAPERVSRLMKSLQRSRQACKYDCGRPHYAKGLCEAHYRRQLYKSQTLTVAIRPRRAAPCFCGRKHYALGFCHGHWQRVKRTGEPGTADLKPHPRRRGEPKRPCTQCAAPACSRGFCDRHYRQWRKLGCPEVDGMPAQLAGHARRAAEDDAELDRRALVMMRSEPALDAWQQRSDYSPFG